MDAALVPVSGYEMLGLKLGDDVMEKNARFIGLLGVAGRKSEIACQGNDSGASCVTSTSTGPSLIKR